MFTHPERCSEFVRCSSFTFMHVTEVACVLVCECCPVRPSLDVLRSPCRHSPGCLRNFPRPDQARLELLGLLLIRPNICNIIAVLFPLFDPHPVISEHSRSLMVNSVANCIFANQNDLEGRKRSLRLSSFIFQLLTFSGKITSRAVRCNVNTHERAFTRYAAKPTCSTSCITTRTKLQPFEVQRHSLP